MAGPKFGSPAWRKKYGLGKKKNSKPRTRRASARRKTAKKKNPTWHKPKSVRIRKGRLEVR